MEKKTINIDYEVYPYNELPSRLMPLAMAARNASLGSYAPYSRFHVGAAVLMADGDILTGSNQENVAYP